MADNYYRHVITEKGLAFLAKQQTGETPNITRVIAGVGFVDESLLEQQTEVLVPVGQMQVGPRKVIDGKVVKLPVRLVNTDLEEDETALIRQIGVYSEDPDEGEILYQLLQYSVPQPLPSVAASRGAPAALSVDIDVVFSNSEAAKINPTPSWGVTLEDLDVANIKQSIMAGEDGKPVSLEYLLRSHKENKEELIKNADAKTTIVDADTIPLSDSAASSKTKKITFGNIKKVLKEYIETTIGIGENLLINAWFAIWQRGTTITNPVNTYICDRYKVNGTGTVKRTTENGGMTITGSINIQYIMEDADYNQIAGQQVTLSYNKGGTIVTKTYLSSAYSAVTGGRIVVNETFAAGTYNWIKLEIGDTATPFTPRSIAEELALCQRYYVLYSSKNYGNCRLAVGTPYNTTTLLTSIALPSQMRSNPTFMYSGAIATLSKNLTNITLSTFINNIATLMCTSTGFVMGEADMFTLGSSTGEIKFDAEL